MRIRPVANLVQRIQAFSPQRLSLEVLMWGDHVR